MIVSKIVRSCLQNKSSTFCTLKNINRSFRPDNKKFQAFRGRGRRPNDSASISTNGAIVGGVAALGLGGLCLYGLSSGPDTSLSAMDKVSVWPSYVKERIRNTYAYLAASTGVCAASAFTLSRNATFMRLMAGGGFMAPICMMVVSIGCGMVCMSIDYPLDASKMNSKHLAWLVYSATLGATLAPLGVVAGPVISQAALYTGTIVGSLSLVGAVAPSDKFLYMGGPLAIGFGVVFVSSIGAMFASPVGRLGMGLQAISLYGGLVLFSGFLLYDTQKVIHRAESIPVVSAYPFVKPYDPINNSIHILLDTINIFVRLVAVLQGNQRKR